MLTCIVKFKDGTTSFYPDVRLISYFHFEYNDSSSLRIDLFSGSCPVHLELGLVDSLVLKDISEGNYEG